MFTTTKESGLTENKWENNPAPGESIRGLGGEGASGRGPNKEKISLIRKVSSLRHRP